MPQKRKISSKQEPGSSQVKRITKSDCLKLICKKKLDALDHEESLTKEDRFSSDERKRLLEAYNQNGFQVFQDPKLLHLHFPERRESDLKGLVERLRKILQPNLSNGEPQPLDDWTKLCQQLMGNFAKDRKVNLDDVFSDALVAEAEERELLIDRPSTSDNNESGTDYLKPNYPKLLRSFSQLLMGRFPDNMTPANAQISMKLFNHINNVVDSLDLDLALSSLKDGTWLESTIEERRVRQEMALKGLEEIDGTTKKCPTWKDFEEKKNIEALCLELPKIRRITDVLNPLFIYESLVSTLME